MQGKASDHMIISLLSTTHDTTRTVGFCMPSIRTVAPAMWRDIGERCEGAESDARVSRSCHIHAPQGGVRDPFQLLFGHAFLRGSSARDGDAGLFV